MSIISEKYNRLTRALVDATENHKVTWEKVSRLNEYKTSFGKETVSIQCRERHGEDGKIVTSYALLLWNKDGKNIDEYTGGVAGTHYALESLFEAARRSNLKVEDTLDTILSKLEA